MTTETDSRQALLAQLADDLAAEGWGQDHKAWRLVGAPGDEYLVRISEFTEHPEQHFIVLAVEGGPLTGDARGLVLMTEGWSYPPALRESFSPEALAAYRELMPPEVHPDRIRTRQLVLTGRDGAVTGMLDYEGDTETEWTFISLPANINLCEPTVDSMRAVLGLNEPLLGSMRAIHDGHVKPMEPDC